MIYVFPRSTRFWKATEYIWLSLAGIGVIAVMQDVFIVVSAPIISGGNKITEFKIYDIKSILAKENTSCEIRKKSLEEDFNHDGENVELLNQLNNQEVIFAFIERTDIIVSKKPDHKTWRERTEHQVQSQDTDSYHLQQLKLNLQKQLEVVYSSEDESKQLHEWLYKTRKYAPHPLVFAFLVIIATALRVTKTSAEVFGYDKPTPEEPTKEQITDEWLNELEMKVTRLQKIPGYLLTILEEHGITDKSSNTTNAQQRSELNPTKRQYPAKKKKKSGKRKRW
jgi:hypothetical protein